MMKVGKIPLIAALVLCALLLVSRANAGIITDLFGAPQGVQCATGSNQANWYDWVTLSFIAILLSMIAMAGSWVLSGAFSSAQYNEYVKKALWGAIETAALLSIFTLSFAGLNEWGVKNIDTARSYATLTRNTIMFDFVLLMGASMATGFVVNINPQFKLPGSLSFVPGSLSFVSLGFQISPMFKPIIDTLNMVMQLVTTAVGLWGAQTMLLCFVKTNMLTLLLPVGFFLRGFGAKGGGDALIGIALAMYFVYPYMMVMMGEVVTSQVERDIDPGSPHLWGSCLDQPICCANPVGITPSTPNEAFIPNGKKWNDPNWATASSYRVKQETILNGPFIMTFQNVGSGLSFCMYNSVLAKLYNGIIVDILDNLSLWGVTKTMGLGIATVLLMKFLGLSWMVVFLMVPITFFTMHSISEMIYFVFIATIMLPLFVLFITLTVAREISKALGTEIDLSALEKLI